MVAAAVGVGTAVAGIAGSAMQSSAAGDAAQTQADAANRASDLQWQQFQQMRQSLQPYMDLGQSKVRDINYMLGSGLLNPQFQFNPTMEQLEQTPGYQFTLNQGLNTLNNQMAAKGLNLSGAQARGIADYTTGLASQTYQQQYQNALQNFLTNYNVNTDQYNRLSGLVGMGENAAAGVGNAGLQTASNAGNFLTSGANALAAGRIGGANAIAGGIGSAAQGGLLYGLMSNQAGAGAGGGIYGNPFSTGLGPSTIQAPAGLSAFGYGS
jgi:hypothetical protein